MADGRIKPSSRLIGGSSQTGFVDQRGMLDGTAFTADWLARMAAEGRMYTINAGTGTAPITSAGAYVNTTPDVDISNPPGQLCIPVAINIGIEAYGTTLLFESVCAVGVGGVITPTAAEALTPVNHRLDLGNTSGLSAVSTGTGATYMTSNVVEFARHQIDKVVTIATADDDSGVHQSNYNWTAMESGQWFLMYHTTSVTRLNVFMSGQATTGFVSVTVVIPPLTV